GLWDDLASEDALVAFRAAGLLATDPAKSLPLLQEKLPPVPVLAATELARLLAALDGKRFPERDRALRQLARLDRSVEAPLKAALEGTLPLEARKRVERLLNDMDRAKTTPDRLPVSRALLALEYCGTVEARKHLEKLAGGAAKAWLTEQAKQSLERIAKP